VCRQFVLGDVPATISVENVSAAMGLVSLDSPLRSICDAARRSRLSTDARFAPESDPDRAAMQYVAIGQQRTSPLYESE